MNQKDLWFQACEKIPGGVNSPVRAFGGVGGQPVFMDRSEGAYLYDIQGKAYIDLVLSFGPIILGHRPPQVIHALQKQLEKGLSYGATTSAEVNLAKQILKMIPNMDMIRLVNSGTEATMSAVRLARGFTKKNKILKFKGCYHGHGDSFLIQAGSGALTHGVPSSLGVTPGVAKDTLVAPYNHLEAVESIFESHPDEIAAVIVEPVAGNMGVVLPKPGFLEGLRALTKKHASLLIFDEVMTGFRVAKGGAAELYQVQPDLFTLGKIIGGGLPLAAYAGTREIMEIVSPLGGVYQAGTLSGNPMATAAGLSQLEHLEQLNPWDDLQEKTQYLAQSLKNAAQKEGVSVQVNQVASMFTVFFSKNAVTDTDSALAANASEYAQFFHLMLERGVYLPPSQYEAAFLSTAHTSSVIESIIDKAQESFKIMAKNQ